ncbi:hypothetical protein BH20VER1_BH20VER1_15560 [soil metagenome]
MKTSASLLVNMIDLGGFTSRRLVATLSFAAGAALILIAQAASPPEATIGPSDTTPVHWVGTAPGGASVGEETCVNGVNCDVFKITVTGTETDWSAHLIALNFGWTLPANDYDFYIRKDSLTGPRVGTGRNDGSPATDDNAAIDPAATGVGDYFVRVVYFAAVGADQYNGTAMVIPKAMNTRAATYTSGGITFSPNTPLKAPVAARDGEPSIRTDYKGNSYAGGIRGVPAGVDLWYVNLDPTSAKFDPLMRFPVYRGQPDGTTQQTPIDVGADGGGDIDLAVGFPPLPGQTEPAVPFLAYSSLTLANISTGITTNRGETFQLNPAGNLTGGPPGDDRQWHEFLGSSSVYLLYRTVAPAIAQVQRSNDGGFTYGPAVAAGLIGQVGCLDVHQATGTVYASGNSGNIAIGTPTVPGQPPTTYTIRQAATDPNGVAHIFFVVKVADDGRPNGTVYALYSNQANIFIRHSTDKGGTWSAPVRVNPPTGPHATNVNLFPWMETGPTPGSVGIVWYGTTNNLNNDNAQWKVYFAQSFNADTQTPEFRVTEVTERDHFIHGSNISEMGLNPTGGSNRNLIDYFQISFDPLGAAVVAYTDDHNDFDGHTFVARQISGPSIRGGELPPVAPGASLGPPPPNPNLEPGDEFPPAQPGPNGEQVTDFLVDVQTALVTRVPTPDAIDIETVKYETVGTGAAQTVKTTIKVTDLTVIPEGSFWRASFAANCPYSVLNPSGEYSFGISDDGDQFYLQANTTDEGVRSFEYGKAVRNPDGSITYTPIGAADAGAFNSTNRTISMEVTVAKLNAVLAAASRPLLQTGSVVAGLRARAVTIDVDLPPPAGRQGRRDLTRGGTQFVIGGSSITPVSVVSRKVHGNAGTFDIPLPLTGTPGIENRIGQPGAGEHQVVVTFANPVAVASGATVDSPGGSGSVSNITVEGAVVTIDLTGVSNAQTITVNLLGVTDGTNTGNVSIPMSLLLGDTTASGAVNSSDVGLTKSFSGQATTAANFRNDVTVNGVINSSDVSTVKSQSGTSLPAGAPKAHSTARR